MHLFKSVFSDDSVTGESDLDDRREPDDSHNDGNSNQTGAWSFGGLVKTLATKSESVIQNYRRDLEDFGSELRRETTIIREVASRAVKDFPASLDVGASVAQDSLESVGQAIDDIGSAVWKSTAQLLASDPDFDASEKRDTTKRLSGNNQSLNMQRYSRFEAQLRAIQNDMNTYVEEPGDLENYYNWKLGFRLDEKRLEIANVVRENEIVAEIYGEAVPSRINHESFWSRYFYKIDQLKQAEEARAEIVKRAISGNEEDDLSWDIEDEDNHGYVAMGETSGTLMSDKNESDDQKMKVKLDEKPSFEGRSDNGDSCKDSDVSIVSSQPSMPGEEDLGWDEIEDIGTIDESRGNPLLSNTNRIDLRKRLSAAEEEVDGDLSWDFDDDDDGEPARS